MRFSSKLREFRKEISFPNWKKLLPDNSSYNRKEQIWWNQVLRVWKIRSYSKRIGFIKHLRLPRDLLDDIVRMDDEMPITRLETKLENWLRNMFDRVGCFKYLCFWKDVNSMKVEKIPWYCDYHLFIWILYFSISGHAWHSHNKVISWFVNK
jgi:hypothetical protein